jgi:hypothetical protein
MMINHHKHKNVEEIIKKNASVHLRDWASEMTILSITIEKIVAVQKFRSKRRDIEERSRRDSEEEEEERVCLC